MRPNSFSIPPLARLVLILAALVLALFLPLVWSGEALSGGDLVNQYIPYKKLWTEELRAGRLPLWNPHTFGGRPHMADVQLGTFYPPNWLLLALPLAAGFTLLAALHLWWGGLGMAVFLRRFGLGDWPALLGGVLIALGGYQNSRLFPGIVFFIFAASWLPWALAALWEIEAGRAKRGAVALAFILTMQLFTGAPQVLYFTLLFTGLIFSLRIILELWTGRDARYANDDFSVSAASWLPASRRWAAALAGAAALFLIMGSPQWPATLEFSGHTVERAEGASYQYASDGSVALRYALLNLVPEIFGPLGNEEIYWGGPQGFWEISCWMGVAPLALAALGALLLIGHWWRAGRESFDGYFWRIQSRGADAASVPMDFSAAHRLFIAAIIIAWGAAWLLALGQNSPAYLVGYYVLPMLNKFRVPGRFLIFHALAISVLAPVALHLLAAPKIAAALQWERRAAIAILAIVAALFIILGVALVPLMDALGIVGIIKNPDTIIQLRESARLSWLRVMIFLLGSIGALVVVMRFPSRCQFAMLVFIAICALELLLYGWRVTQSKPPTAIAGEDYARSEAVAALEARRDLGRFLCDDSIYAWQFDQNQPELFPNRPMMHGLYDARGYDPLYLAPYSHVISLAAGLPPMGSKGAFLFVPQIAAPPLVSMLNIRTVLSYDKLGAPFAEIKRIDFADGTALRLYDNPQAMGWAWLAGVGERPAAPPLNIMLAQPERVASQALLDPDDWDWLKGEFSETEWKAMTSGAAPLDRGRVEIAERRPGYFEINAAAAAPSMLVVSENVYPGWRAEINGQPAAVLRVNHTLIGVPVPAGDHAVILHFTNPRLLYSLIAALATAILALALLRSRYFEPREW